MASLVCRYSDRRNRYGFRIGKVQDLAPWIVVIREGSLDSFDIYIADPGPFEDPSEDPRTSLPLLLTTPSKYTSPPSGEQGSSGEKDG
jgi:hypothetical protein